MITIKVVFRSFIPSTLKEVMETNPRQYTFNCKNELQVGDVIKTERYTGYLVVTEVCHYIHSYVSAKGITSENKNLSSDRPLSVLAEMGNDEQFDIPYTEVTTIKIS
jgi:hypothetical protein